MKLYKEVTDRIVSELEAGAVPWLCPWRKSRSNGTGIMPVNAITGRNYHGINVVILWSKRAAEGYESNGWLTYRQAQAVDAQVRKGEKATEVVFTRKLRIKDRDTEEERQISMLRSFFVFSVAQVEGLPVPNESGALPVSTEEHHRAADHFVDATRADIRHGGTEAAFYPSLDYVVMPPFKAFKTTEGYYATKLHELGHWSGHTARLDRNLAGRFGTRAYAAEELVAELTSAFLCAHLGIEGELRHAGYLQHWAELLRHDDKAIFTAAAKAQQAADFLTAFSQPIEED
jgi:antirestriction protein ArdC